MTDVEEKGKEVTEPLKGRAAWIERYKKANPEIGEEIEDESLYEFANGGYSDLEGRFNQLNGVNSKLAERVAEDPRLGAALSMVVGEEKKSLPYAMGKVFGKDWIEGDLDEFEAGYQENLQKLAESDKLQSQAQKNIEASVERIEKFISDNQLGEEDATKLNENLVIFAENLLMGDIPTELIELVYKGQSYDEDVKEAIDTGAVQARNERIEPELKKLTETSVVDMGSSTAGKKKQPARKRGGSFYDEMKEETV